MQNIEDIKITLRNNKDLLSQKYGVKTIGVFGSYARGDYSGGSDIDIMVEFDKPIGLAFVILADDLEKLLHAKVDLVSKKAIKPRMMKFIEEDIIYV